MRQEELRVARAVPRILNILKKHRVLAAPDSRKTAEVALLSNAVLRRLKRTYLKKNAPVVDVLAFPFSVQATKSGPVLDFPSPDSLRGSLGEVYLNRDIVRRQPMRGLELLIHGILHLLGFDHRGKRDTMEMQGLEAKILRELKGGSGASVAKRPGARGRG